MVEGLVELEQRTFSSLHFRNYRLYLVGQGISLCGSWMQIVAQSWLVLQLTGSGTALGLLAGLQSLPMLVCSPWFGVLIDRLPKRRILYVTQLLSGLLALGLGLLVHSGTVTIWMVYVFALALGLINAIDYPTRQAFMVELVGPDYLANAISLYAGESNLSRVIGPVLAGAAITFFGLASCFMLNAVSFLGLIIVLWMMRGKELYKVPLVRVEPGQLMQGLRYAWVNPIIRTVLLMTLLISTLAMEFQILTPLFAREVFGGGVALFSVLTSWLGIGAVLGSLFAAEVSRSTRQGILLTSVFMAASMVLAAITPTLLGAKMAMLAIGFFGTVYVSLANVALQLASKAKMRGRIMALWAVAFAGTTVVGGPIIGWVAEHAGAKAALELGGAAALVAAVYGYLSLGHRRTVAAVTDRLGS